MRKTPNPAPQPKFPPVTKKCKYCHVTFKTPPTYNGQQQEFCIPAHRKAFHKEGRKPIFAILKRQEKHMRQIAREEIAAAFKLADIPGLASVIHELGRAQRIRERLTGDGPIGREAAQALVDSFSPRIVGVAPGPVHDAILDQYAPWNEGRNKK
jgi:hypothetical protein